MQTGNAPIEGSQCWMGGAARPELVMERGEGCRLFDAEGNAYLDFVGGWAVNALGHAHPALTAALKAQAERLVHCSPGFWNRPALELARLLCELTGMERVFLGCTGAEANECAIKLARLHGKLRLGGAHRILLSREGFHGRTLATMAATGKEAWRGLFGPDLTGFVHLPYGDLAAFEAAVGPGTCAVMLEPIQGEAGVVPATREFLHGLRGLCDRHGLLLIADEVQTGLGRTGSWTVTGSMGVRPDILTLGKGLGGGVPVSACLCRREHDLFSPGDQGGTFTYHPLGAAAALAVLGEIHSRDLLGNVRARGEQIGQILSDLAARFGLRNLRGSGLLRAFDLPAPDGQALVVQARDEGLLLNSPRPCVIRLMPPLTVSGAEVEEFAGRLARSLEAMG